MAKAKAVSKWKFYSMGIALLIIGYIAGNVGTFLTDEDCQAFKVSTVDIPTTSDAQQTPATEEPAQQDPTLHEKIDENGFFYIGDENAPMTMMEFTDYQCPFCQRYFFGAFQQIKEKYIQEGKLKYVVAAPLPYHQNSGAATYAALCAGEQGKFFDMHEKLFIYQNSWSYSENPEEEMLKYAKGLNLDTVTFQICLQNGSSKFSEKISKAMIEASKKGLQGTPTFLIGDTPFVGAQPFADFEKLLK